MDLKLKRRLHWLMYGLFYPAVLGACVVVALQRAVADSISGPALAVAVTAGVFFSFSFASAMGLDAEYGLFAFIMDIAEVLLMYALFVYLDLFDSPAAAGPPEVTVAYLVLIYLVALQLAWRWGMELQVGAFLDLKVLLLTLLFFGASLGDHLVGLHWAITVIFSGIAVLYVWENPYEKDAPAPEYYFAK